MKRLFLLFASIFFIMLAARGQTTINFSGISWNVRNGTGGPGPNLWSDDPANVWVDTLGYLHMKIRKENDQWFCSEIYSQKSFGYGDYTFELLSDPEVYDPRIVAGLFTYEDDSREIDIEFARWGNVSGLTSWYTVQPAPYTSENQFGFRMGLQGSPSSHSFRWTADSIFFRSAKPFTFTLPPLDSTIAEWTYDGPHIPPVGNERLHLNFWLFQGQPPLDGNEAELIIKSVKVHSIASEQESEKESKIQVFPNPAKDMVRIKFEGPAVSTRIRLLNALGVQLLELVSDKAVTEIDISRYYRGMHCIIAEREGKVYSTKFMIIP
ncbi:MAG: T9SS type A sorting domain-containing protein [Bacteroidales bacterium]|nr:T9SS type A sorting domain-containing protein [Bacteroidales bacterium]